MACLLRESWASSELTKPAVTARLHQLRQDIRPAAGLGWSCPDGLQALSRGERVATALDDQTSQQGVDPRQARSQDAPTVFRRYPDLLDHRSQAAGSVGIAAANTSHTCRAATL